MHNRRCVFKDYPDPDNSEFFEKIMSVIQKIELDGVHLELMSDESSHVTKIHQILWQSDEQLSVELSIVRDLHDEICYAEMSSKQSWISKRARELFHDSIECYSINELIDICSRRFFEPNMLIALGLLGRKPDADMMKTISAALDSESPKIRYAAARAAAITQWDAFEPDLELMLKMESDNNARQAAELALKECAKK